MLVEIACTGAEHRSIPHFVASHLKERLDMPLHLSVDFGRPTLGMDERIGMIGVLIGPDIVLVAFAQFADSLQSREQIPAGCVRTLDCPRTPKESQPLMLKLSEKLPFTETNCTLSDVEETVSVAKP